MERLYAEIAEVKEPSTEIIFGMFAVWAVLRGYPIRIGQLEGTPERKIRTL
jgi:hypothetical protein